jgi:hypothetical protein
VILFNKELLMVIHHGRHCPHCRVDLGFTIESPSHPAIYKCVDCGASWNPDYVSYVVYLKTADGNGWIGHSGNNLFASIDCAHHYKDAAEANAAIEHCKELWGDVESADIQPQGQYVPPKK